MSKTNYGSQPIKNEQSGTTESWAVIISKIIESIEVPNVDKDPEGSIKGMKTLNDINDLIKIIINLESNANLPKQPHSNVDMPTNTQLLRKVESISNNPKYQEGYMDGAVYIKSLLPHTPKK